MLLCWLRLRSPPLMERTARKMNMKQAKVLLCDDDWDVAKQTAELLRPHVHSIDVVRSLEQFRRITRHNEFDLILLDLTLPDGSGLDLIREVREVSEVGLIVVSGASGESDIVAAVELGADDYLTKPLSVRELVARMVRLYSRTAGQRFSRKLSVLPLETRWCFDHWVFDPGRYRLIYSDDGSTQDVEVTLTTAEHKVLQTLVEASGRVLSREQLMRALHDGAFPQDVRNVDGLVSRLRRKLDCPQGYRAIITVRGAGYAFAPKTRKAVAIQ